MMTRQRPSDSLVTIVLVLVVLKLDTCHGYQQYETGAETIVTTAGFNMTLSCPPATEVFVLMLTWSCMGCEINGVSSSHMYETLFEYKADYDSPRHDKSGRIKLDENFALQFKPVVAQDSGLYRCTVNNAEGHTFVKLIVQDKPDPPGLTLVDNYKSRQAVMTWTHPTNTHNSPVTHYIVQIKMCNSNAPWDTHNGRATQGNVTRTTVDGLLPYTAYQFRVVAVNALGQSNPGQESYCMITHREVPDGKPVFISAHNVSASSIELKWKPPPHSTINGEFTGYRLTLRPNIDPVNEEDIIKLTIKDLSHTTTVVKGLKTYTQYLISLQVLNPVGAGPNATKMVMTDEGIPSPPRNLTVTGKGDKFVSLSWIKPLNPNGDINGYRVFFVRGNFTDVRTVNIATEKINYTLTNIRPMTDYTIWTYAFTENHEGNSSDSVNVTTDVSEPGPPFISNLTCQSDTTLYLQWRRPGEVYGQVDLYYIYYRPDDSDAFEFDEITVKSVNNRLEHNFLITNLSANTMYEVKVRGGTYSKYTNRTYKGRFSLPRNIQLFPDCHSTPHSSSFFTPRVPWGEMDVPTWVFAVVFCLLIALVLLTCIIIIYRKVQGSYYYLDESTKPLTGVLNTEWENETGGDGLYGPVDVHHFAMHVSRLHADGDIGFSKEYEAIQAATQSDALTADHSHHPDNKPKNRYLNIVAYDHSRVPLRPLPGQSKRSTQLEYVNANYIDGYDKAKAYIGTQGPLPSTFDTFWRMVWEQRVHIIVMITNLVERGRKKCDQYWPKEGIETYGLIQVRLVQEDVFATYTIRKFAIKHMKVKCTKSGSNERIILQYHYTNWPDHGTPDHPLSVLSFVRISAAANPDNGGPIIVHCSAGVGRTGTYIVLDAMLRQIKSKGKLNVYGFLKHIREQRNFLVQTEEQYMFIHDALVEAIESGNTRLPAHAISKYISSLQQAGGPDDSQWFLLNHQMKMATQFIPEEYNVLSATKPSNGHKNRTNFLLPIETGRVHLTPKAGVDGSDYINATWLMGYNRLKEFVITQHPLNETIMDFWQMVYDHNAQTIVLLNAVNEEANCPQFWPNEGEEFDSENWKVRFLETRVHSGLVTVELTIQSLQDDYELPIRLIMAQGWPHTLPALSNTLSLVSLLHDSHQNYQNGPMVVVDLNGGTESSMFCLLTTLKSQLEYEKFVDPFLYFKLYHNRRPGIWNSQDDLLFIYLALESHIGSQYSLNAPSSSSCDLAALSDPPVISPLPPITIIPHSLPSLIPTSVQQPCDLIATSSTPVDLTPPQTPNGVNGMEENLMGMCGDPHHHCGEDGGMINCATSVAHNQMQLQQAIAQQQLQHMSPVDNNGYPIHPTGMDGITMVPPPPSGCATLPHNSTIMSVTSNYLPHCSTLPHNSSMMSNNCSVMSNSVLSPISSVQMIPSSLEGLPPNGCAPVMIYTNSDLTSGVSEGAEISENAPLTQDCLQMAQLTNV